METYTSNFDLVLGEHSFKLFIKYDNSGNDLLALNPSSTISLRKIARLLAFPPSRSSPAYHSDLKHRTHLRRCLRRQMDSRPDAFSTQYYLWSDFVPENVCLFKDYTLRRLKSPLTRYESHY